MWSIFALLLFAVLVYVYFLGIQTLVAFNAWDLGRRVPAVKITPVPLADLTVSQSPGGTVAACGYQFETPWPDLDEAKTNSSAAVTITYYKSGLALAASCFSAHELVNGFLSSYKTTPERFARAFGDKALQSDYGLTQTMLETTPSQITILTPSQVSSGKLLVLLMKAAATPSADSGIFAIHAGDFDGSQYGDPTRQPKNIVVDLFAPDRKIEFLFALTRSGSPMRISQEEINRVLQTLRKDETPNASAPGR